MRNSAHKYTNYEKNNFTNSRACVLSLSCSNASVAGKKESVQLNNTSWVLEENSKTNSGITLEIAKGRVSGFSGCNNYFSELTTNSKDTFQVKSIGATRMLCDNISVEEDYLNLLEKVNKYVISETSLELYKDNVLLLKFKRK